MEVWEDKRALRRSHLESKEERKGPMAKGICELKYHNLSEVPHPQAALCHMDTALVQE